MRTAALVLWAAAATVLAFAGWLREPRPERAAAPRQRYAEREKARRLERRVEELEAALAEVVPPSAAPGDASLATLLEADAVLQEDENWTAAKSQALARQIYARLAADAAAHLELVELLKKTGDGDEADRILGYLLESPFTGMVRDAEVWAKIRAAARGLLVAPQPHLRIAGARVLLGYGVPPDREDVVLALGRLSEEPEAEAFDALLEEIADKGRGVPLTEAEAAPLLQRLREGVRRGHPWAASMLADWSDSEEDFDRTKAAFLEEPSQETLNAFRRESRMVGPRVDACRAFLLQVLEDPATDNDVRLLAAHLLRGYAPWDAATAEAVARASR
jgi:hypothetical protein